MPLYKSEGLPSRDERSRMRPVSRSPITACELPANALLRSYNRGGAYTDCFVTAVPSRIDFARYVEAFYTTWLFWAERWMIGLAGMPSTDAEARRLSIGYVSAFSAWRVEARGPDQILLSDAQGRTRSWLMSAPGPAMTALYFGSAIVPCEGHNAISAGFRTLIGFHRLYSRALLGATARRLLSTGSGGH